MKIGEVTEVLGKTYPSANFFTTNPIWPDLGSNSATNRRSRGTHTLLSTRIIPTEIRNEHLPDTSLERNRYSNLLGFGLY
jgi:hypothetical protein